MRIENDYLKVEVALEGGALTSIYDKKRNLEHLYQKDERSWMGQDVVIFPIIGAIKDRECIIDGKVYSMKNHGLIRYVTLDVVSHKADEIVLGYRYNEDTLKQYPYKFNFEICYSLNENELKIEYRVYNLDDKDLFFNVGGHPALIVDGYENETGYVFENVKLLFDKDYEVDQFMIDDSGSLISHVEKAHIPAEYVISKGIIAEAKTLIYDTTDINEVTLVSNDKVFKFDITQSNVLAIWSKPGFGNYLCVEPWWGIPDYNSTNKQFTEKPLIRKLPTSETFITNFKIKFE